MTKLIVAALMNLFLLPGFGQVWLKRKRIGYAIMIVSGIFVIYVTAHLTSIITGDLQSVLTSSDPEAIARMMPQLNTFASDSLAKHSGAIKLYGATFALIYGFSLWELIATYRKSRPSSR